MNNPKTFKAARYNIVAWIWTITYTLALLFFSFRAFSALVEGFFPDPVDIFFTVVLLFLFFYALFRSARGYIIEGEELVIVRVGPGRLHIPLAEVEAASAEPNIGAFFNIGLLSVGGVFGWAGRTRVRNPSDLKSLEADVYGANPRYSVVLDLKSGRKVILTPAEPKEMEAALHMAGAGKRIHDPRPVIRPRTSSPSTSPGPSASDPAPRRDPGKPKPWLQGNKK